MLSINISIWEITRLNFDFNIFKYSEKLSTTMIHCKKGGDHLKYRS